MFAKKLAGLLLATTFLLSGGCCRMWERWCNDRHQCQQPVCCAPVQCCPAPAATCPPPGGSFSSPVGAVPVPAAPNSSWVRPCP